MHSVFRKRPEEVKTSERHLFIVKFRDKYTVKQMCKVLGVTESGFYRWLRNKAKPAKRELLLVEIKNLIGEAPENRNYSINRIQTALEQKGKKVSLRTVYRTMNEGGLLHKTYSAPLTVP